MSSAKQVFTTLGLVLLTLSASVGNNAKSGLELVNVNGRDYVSSTSIVEFYPNGSLSRSGKRAICQFLGDSRKPEASRQKIVMVVNAGSQTLTIQGIKFIMSFAAIQHNGDVYVSRLDLAKLIDPVLQPKQIKKKGDKIFDTVVIDPGHGGHDSGAVCSLGKESYFALDTARRLGDLLKKKGFKVFLTRESDRYVTLGDRVKFANTKSNAIFVSLHYNSAQSRAYGIETFALSPQGASSTFTGARSSDHVNLTGNARDSENIALATAIHAYSLKRAPTTDRGIKRARWSVLTGLRLPGVLFEGGFLSNPNEARKVASSDHRQKLASAICEGIVNYRDALIPK